MPTVPIQTTSIPTALTHSLRDYMKTLRNKIAKRAFAIFEKNGASDGHALEDWLKAESEFLTPIILDISETNTALTLKATVPGFSEKNLEVVVEPKHVFITGKLETESEDKKKKRVIYSELMSNEIFRSVDLPAEIDPARVTAELQDGILEITLPKAVPAKANQLAITAKAA